MFLVMVYCNDSLLAKTNYQDFSRGEAPQTTLILFPSTFFEILIFDEAHKGIWQTSAYKNYDFCKVQIYYISQNELRLSRSRATQNIVI